MANDTVFILANKKDSGQFDGTLLLPDCTVNIEHRFENEITEHPIDGSGNVSDHVVTKNQVITMSGSYNQHTLRRYAGDNISYENRVADAYTKLKDLRDSKQTFTVVSRYDVYTDCVVRSLIMPITPDNGNSLVFNMEIVQVRISDNITPVNLVQIENVSEDMLDNAAFKQASGTKQKQRVSSTAAANSADGVINGRGG